MRDNIHESLRALAVPLRALHEDPRNARTHDPASVAAIRESFERFGQRKPIVVQRSGRIVRAGNGMLQAARDLGWKNIAAVIVDEDDAAAAAFALADNRTAELSAWDPAALNAVLEDLRAAEVDLAGVGFTPGEIEALTAPPLPSRTGADDAAAAVGVLPEDPDRVGIRGEPPPSLVKPGDVWQLGAHRLVCGDSTLRETCAAVLGDRRADLIFTDPPYGVNVTGAGGRAIAGDLTFTAIPLFFARVPDILDRKGWCYVCGGYSNILLYARLFEETFRRLPGVIVWDKATPVLRHNGYHSRFELVFFSFHAGGGGKWYGPRGGEPSTDIWTVPVDRGNERHHVTQKPIELPYRAISNTCPPGGLVCDPFAGSGATLLAAERAGRAAAVMESSATYCDVIVDRWQRMTGQEAERLTAGARTRKARVNGAGKAKEDEGGSGTRNEARGRRGGTRRRRGGEAQDAAAA